MIGCNKGLVSSTKEQNGNAIVSQCFLHRESLMSRTLGKGLRSSCSIGELHSNTTS